MSKPLKLTIHPRLEDTNLSPEDIRQGRRTELRLGRRKRFTDAELAAEYHAWDAHLKHLRWCELASGDELSRESWRKLNARLETLWWFATLPDHDEPQP